MTIPATGHFLSLVLHHILSLANWLVIQGTTLFLFVTLRRTGAPELRMKDTVAVTYTREKGCFCSVSSRHLYSTFRSKSRQTVNPVCLKVTDLQTSTCVYVSATNITDSGTGQPTLNIPGLFAASCLHLKDKTQVQVEIIKPPLVCTSAFIEPVSQDDWDIMEMHPTEIKSNLLHQIRLIWKGQKIPITIGKKTIVFARVGNIEPQSPNACYLLASGTELYVSGKDKRRQLSAQQQSAAAEYQSEPPKVKPQKQPKASKSESSSMFGFGFLSNLLPSSTPQEPVRTNKVTPSQSAIDYPETKPWPQFYSDTPIIARVETINPRAYEEWWSHYPSVCVISKDLVPAGKRGPFIANLTLLRSPGEIEAEEVKQRKAGDSSADSVVDMFINTVCVIVGGVGAPEVKAGHVLLDETLCRLRDVKITSKVKLEFVKPEGEQIKLITIQPAHDIPKECKGYMNEDVITYAFTEYVKSAREPDGYPLVLNKSSVVNMKLPEDKRGDFLLMVNGVTSPFSEQHFLLTSEMLPHVKLEVNKDLTKRYANHHVVPPMIASLDKHVPIKPAGYADLYKQCQDFVTSTLSCGAYGGLLITGPRGSGKTTLACHTAAEMYKKNGCYTHVLDGKLLKGKRSDGIRKELDKAIKECVWRQPSLLYIEDLDSLCRAPAGPEEETNPDTVYSLKAAEVIKDRLNEMWRCNKETGDKVVVIATSVNRTTLHEKLTPTHGVHMFHLTVEIPALTQSSRCELLMSILEKAGVKHTPTDKELLALSDRLEGYVAQDIVSLVRRASHAHTIAASGTEESSTGTVTLEDFDKALDNFTPASLRGVALHSPGENTWADVGGLKNVREQLVRMLEWPTKYRKLYAQCPIRLQSGVLLYGAPGTGKTLIAAVVAKEMGLNFISIKGPELLNKYIGASEQGVRDTFTRAQSVRPCILFFDEFESLAPKRGHDSTGVTDRVVNQLLTQLDGVEALEGVYVLAATSRPDLIDPALLRPGRLDKSLICEVPSYEDRLDIFNALSKDMAVDGDVTLKDIAACCENYTGADIKALLVNAQLEAVHAEMNKSANYTDTALKDEDDMQNICVQGIYRPANKREMCSITPQSDSYHKIRKVSAMISKHSARKQKTTSQPQTSASPAGVTITMAHLQTALASLKPSVSEVDQRRYRMIYERFSGSKTEKAAANRAEVLNLEQKVSLA